MSDMVNSPPHYKGHPAGIEAIEVLRHATDFDLGQAMRYLWRVMWGGKWDSAEDVAKAVWYCQDWLKKREAEAAKAANVTLPERSVWEFPATFYPSPMKLDRESPTPIKHVPYCRRCGRPHDEADFCLREDWHGKAKGSSDG